MDDITRAGRIGQVEEARAQKKAKEELAATRKGELLVLRVSYGITIMFFGLIFAYLTRALHGTGLINEACAGFGIGILIGTGILVITGVLKPKMPTVIRRLHWPECPFLMSESNECTCDIIDARRVSVKRKG